MRTPGNVRDIWATRSIMSGHYQRSRSTGQIRLGLHSSRIQLETDPLETGRSEPALDPGPERRRSLWDPLKVDSSASRTDFFRFVDTKIRRIEARGTDSSRIKLTGTRRQLKDILDALGRISTVYPFIADDGDGGVFAEWKAGRQRIEIAVEQDSTAYISVSDNGETVWFLEFDPSEKLSFDEIQRLRQIVERHSVIVSRVNPQWRRLFTVG